MMSKSSTSPVTQPATWLRLSSFIIIFVVMFAFMFAASCSTATIASNSWGYTDLIPAVFLSFMLMHSSGVHRFCLLPSGGGAMLAPAMVLPE